MGANMRWYEKPLAEEQMAKVNALLTLVMTYDPDGARRLCGDMPEPEWTRLVDGLRNRIDIGRVDGSKTFSPKVLDEMCMNETVDEMLNYAGGWGRIVRCCQKVKEAHPKGWLLFENPPALTCKAQDLILQHIRNSIRVAVLGKVARLSVRKKRKEWAKTP